VKEQRNNEFAARNPTQRSILGQPSRIAEITSTHFAWRPPHWLAGAISFSVDAAVAVVI
jgi:hypothetical protein